MSRFRTVHRELLDRWRHVTNLVGPGEVAWHFDDCTRALGWLQPAGRWVDLGSGAGFPGLVLADLFPQLVVELVDSRQRRCAFLERVLTEAEIPPDRVTVRCQRVEALPPHHYDGVVSRAFAPPHEVVEHGDRLLRPHGALILFLQDDADVPDDPRFEVFHVERYVVADKARKSVGLRRPRA